MNQEFIKELADIVGESNVYSDEVMARHITFRVGGKAKYLVDITGEEELVKVISLMKKWSDIPYYIIGNGSNMLFTDEGYDGLIIKISNKMADVDIHDLRIVAKAGAMLSRVAKLAYEEGLSGMERLSGIPGTIGGGVSKAGQFLLDVIEKHFKKNAFVPCSDVKFVIASLGNDAGIYGAVAQVL